MNATPATVGPSRTRRAAQILGDLAAAIGAVLVLPFVLLAIGTPIVLFVRLVLWATGML